jgi:UPF0716 protein FxsA
VWLFLIFLGVPILEIALFIQVGGLIGLWPTLAIVVLTAVAGTALMRLQGMSALERLRKSIAEGGDPVGPIAHGALILAAGMLLLTPGFFTDSIGLLLLVPAVRERVIAWGAARLTVRAASFASAPAPRRPGGTGATIDADYEVLDAEREPEDPPPEQRRSGWTRR